MNEQKGMNVFHIPNEEVKFDLEKAKKTLSKKLEKSWIKQRTQGRTTLSYIGGHTVIHLLNHAFNYQWSFEIVKEEIAQSEPKPIYVYENRQRVLKTDNQGNPVKEPQPPVAKVLGRLTVPGLGVKEQFGSKILVGGASEQESAFKAASTDALKKCASLFGIGLELYGEEEYDFEDEQVQETQPQSVQQNKPASQQPVNTNSQETKNQASQAPQQETRASNQGVQEPDQPANQSQSQTPNITGWNKEDVMKLKELKQILGIETNDQLSPFVVEFTDDPTADKNNITPDNIGAFNIFLSKKAETM